MQDTNMKIKMQYESKAVSFGPPAASVICEKFFSPLLTQQCASSDKLHSAAKAPSNMKHTPCTYPQSLST